MDVKKIIEQSYKNLTIAERKIASALLSDYPFAGLETIQSFASKTQVSPPSITRFTYKLGYQGYQDFQYCLIHELKEKELNQRKGSPLDLHQSQELEEDYFHKNLALRAQMIEQMSGMISASRFEEICEYLSDRKRKIYVIGGRFSDPIAQFFGKHLSLLRDGVVHLPSDQEALPDYILQMRPSDVCFMIDFRRYQQHLFKLAKIVSSQRKSSIILLTDKWSSPVAQYAREVISIPIDTNTAWDSYAGALVFVEILYSWIAERDWELTKKRIEMWDSVRTS